MLPLPSRVRIARHTEQLETIVAFYRDGLGLLERARFADHAGYDGVVLQLGAGDLELEFTAHPGQGSHTAHPDELIAISFADGATCTAMARRLVEAGGVLSRAANPYWDAVGATAIADPDGTLILLVPDGATA